MEADKAAKFKVQREIALSDIKDRWDKLQINLLLPSFLDLRFKDLSFILDKRESAFGYSDKKS